MHSLGTVAKAVENTATHTATAAKVALRHRGGPHPQSGADLEKESRVALVTLFQSDRGDILYSTSGLC
jgi:hypothetical protein